MTEQTVAPAQQVLRDQGMCGAFVNDTENVCILDPATHVHVQLDRFEEVKRERDRAMEILHELVAAGLTTEQEAVIWKRFKSLIDGSAHESSQAGPS